MKRVEAWKNNKIVAVEPSWKDSDNEAVSDQRSIWDHAGVAYDFIRARTANNIYDANITRGQ